MKETGFYIIKDEFFKKVNDPYLKGNKKSNRPHYYCFKDELQNCYWMIPLSSRLDKYRNIIEKREKNNKSCDILHIAKLDNGKESVFLIQDMFPITQEYVERKYTIGGNHLMITSEHLATEIDKKAKKVMEMRLNGVKFFNTQADVIRILEMIKDKTL